MWEPLARLADARGGQRRRELCVGCGSLLRLTLLDLTLPRGDLPLLCLYICTDHPRGVCKHRACPCGICNGVNERGVVFLRETEFVRNDVFALEP